MIQENIKNIFNELDFVLKNIDQSQCDELINNILWANKIVWVGAWRVWMATKAFIMRLWHLWLSSWFLWDSTVPWIWKWDLLLVASWSWETQTIFDLVEIAKKNGCTIALITWNPDSRMWKLADSIVKITAPSKTKAVDWFQSVQPMTTLNEQCLFLFFDAFTLDLMSKMNKTHDTMRWRHSNLE
jgi:6-phospho-3-hexuloisomerase